MHPIRSCALALVFVLAAGEAAQAQRVPLVSPPTARRLASPQRAAQQCGQYVAPSSLPAEGAALVMAPDTFSISGTRYARNVYNGQYVAPVLRMDVNKRLNIHVSNRMQPLGTQQPQSQIDTTNQHYHGMVVTPLPDTGDNVVNVPIAQGKTIRNAFWVPPFQSQGMMWYHPHPHGRTANQVSGGLAGAMIIGDLLASFPAFRAAGGPNERVMYIKDTNNTGTAILNVNGNTCTALTIAPGQMQLWRIGNMTAGTWVNLRLGERGQGYRFIVLALDGNHLTRPTPMDSLFLAPGQRAEAVVIGGSGPYAPVAFYSAPFATSFDTATKKLSGTSPRVDLGTLSVTPGAPQRVAPEALSPRLIPENAALVDSIRRLVTATDVDTFTVHYQFFGKGVFALNGRDYNTDPTKLDRAVAVGRPQEWTLINETWFNHTFHIHQTDFVVTKINGVDQPDSVHLDNVHLGIHQLPNGNWAPDTVVVRFTFHPIAAGPFVYHCHDLFHEDRGMMANVCVYDPARGQTPGTCRQWFPGGGHAHGGPGGGDGAPAHSAHGTSDAIAAPRRE